MWTGVLVSVYFKAAVKTDRELTVALSAKDAKRRSKWPKREDLPFLESSLDLDPNWYRVWKPEHGYRLPVRKFTLDSRFDQFIALGILVNLALMTVDSFKQSEMQTRIGVIQNFFFTTLFGAEVGSKMYALHPSRFLTSPWHQFDYFITLTSFGGIAIEESGTAFGFDPTIVRILRIFRILRIIKVLLIIVLLYMCTFIHATMYVSSYSRSSASSASSRP
jgi:hypothetical protein